MANKRNLVTRRVCVVMADTYHTLQLVEVTVPVRGSYGVECFEYAVDKNQCEKLARARLPKPKNEWSDWSMVGVLVAHDDPLARGRITWAKEVETVEAVSL